jgi:hypothetical protein
MHWAYRASPVAPPAHIGTYALPEAVKAAAHIAGYALAATERKLLRQQMPPWFRLFEERMLASLLSAGGRLPGTEVVNDR